MPSIPNPQNFQLAIIGLGYVGLPLAAAFGQHFPTLGFDISSRRIDALKAGTDDNLELSKEEFNKAEQLTFTSEAAQLAQCNVYIVTVPTPIDDNRNPDLSPLESACQLISNYVSPGDIVIFESTVYPGCTEEFCLPIIEKETGLTFNQDFFAGYSPERINPGDTEHRLHNTIKITSGSRPDVADLVDGLYNTIVEAGTHKASSIRVAEAAKVIENVQRDTNIALVNELALIFKRLGIDTHDVLAAAGTKWNFLPFKPGLVGGHCIGVDPYYLVNKAERVNYHPEIIAASRRVNESIPDIIASDITRLMTQKRIHIVDSNILVLGLAFKENCPDLRNTRVVDIIHELQKNNANVHIYDPWVDAEDARKEYDLELIEHPQEGIYDAVVVAVAHSQFTDMGAEGISRLAKKHNHVIYDIKSVLPRDTVDGWL